MEAILKLLSGDGAKALGNLLAGGASAYAAYSQGQTAKQLAKMQLDEVKGEKERRKRTQGSINTAFAKLPLY